MTDRRPDDAAGDTDAPGFRRHGVRYTYAGLGEGVYTVSVEARAGNAAPRVGEFDGGMINAVGLANPGLDAVRATGGTEVNAALNGLVYDPDQDVNGSDTLEIDVDDLGNTGTGAGTDSHDVSLTLTPVNDAPVNTLPTAGALEAADDGKVDLELLTQRRQVGRDRPATQP